MSGFSVLTASVTTGPLWLSGIWQIGAPETAAALQRRVHLLHERPTGGNDLTGLPGTGRNDRVLSADSQGVIGELSEGVIRKTSLCPTILRTAHPTTDSGEVVGSDDQDAHGGPRSTHVGQTFDPIGSRELLRSDACHLTATLLKV